MTAFSGILSSSYWISGHVNFECILSAQVHRSHSQHGIIHQDQLPGLNDTEVALVCQLAIFGGGHNKVQIM